AWSETMTAPTGTSPAPSAFFASTRAKSMYSASDPKTMGACYTRKMGNGKGNGTLMKLLSKLALFFFLTPAWLVAQPGVRMSADFLPLEVGNRWVYDVFNESGQKVGDTDFLVQEYKIVNGRSFYLLTRFPFAENGGLIKLVRYDRQERQYMRMADNE